MRPTESTDVDVTTMATNGVHESPLVHALPPSPNTPHRALGRT
ncbi:hypothetical protein [Rhodococcus sp. 1168]|nr:hypothetical protein [Rhodococcus sp. 1168]